MSGDGPRPSTPPPTPRPQPSSPPGPGRHLIELPAEVADLYRDPDAPGHCHWPAVTPTPRGAHPLEQLPAALTALIRRDPHDRDLTRLAIHTLTGKEAAA